MHLPGHEELSSLSLLGVAANSDDRTPTLITRCRHLRRPEETTKTHLGLELSKNVQVLPPPLIFVPVEEIDVRNSF